MADPNVSQNSLMKMRHAVTLREHSPPLVTTPVQRRSYANHAWKPLLATHIPIIVPQLTSILIHKSAVHSATIASNASTVAFMVIRMHNTETVPAVGSRSGLCPKKSINQPRIRSSEVSQASFSTFHFRIGRRR